MHISVIDDEKILADKILKKLRGNGYSVNAFYGYQDFLSRGNANSELYIVDISLWDGSWFDIVKRLRKQCDCKAPIIIISGFSDSQNIVYGLDIGADDYLTKPVMPEELIARIKAILRRPKNLITEKIVRKKNISFNLATREVFVGEKPLFLPKHENLLLEYLLLHQDRIASRDAIITHIWGSDKGSEISDNVFAVTLSNLRKKIRPHLSVRTVYNFGCILE